MSAMDKLISKDNLDRGLEIIKKHDLFGRMNGQIVISNKAYMGKDSAAFVDGLNIYLNQDYNMNPKEWAFTIAHCLLHIAFNHYDIKTMPGYYKDNIDGTKEWKVICDKNLWINACDIYITKFLYDIKFGDPIVKNPTDEFGGGLNDERKIYDRLVAMKYSSSTFPYGTCNELYPDIHELGNMKIYNILYGNPKTSISDNFAKALSSSVSSTIMDVSNVKNVNYSRGYQAATWFINNYPLLGSLASHFKIVEDHEICNKLNISIAAIDIDNATIYLNNINNLSDDEIKFILAHEYLHAGLEHRSRCQGRNYDIWNAACDFVINGWLVDMHVGVMPKIGALYDEKFKNESAENIYDFLIRNIKEYKDLSSFRGYGKGDILPNKGISKSFGRGDNEGSGYTTAEEYCKSALILGLDYQELFKKSRGLIPLGLIEEIRALAVPPIPWDVELGKWFDINFLPTEKARTYARISRRQGSTPNIPRPRYVKKIPDEMRTFGVVVDTSGSMSVELIGYALGAIASYSEAKEIPLIRVIFCDAEAYDAGYLTPDEIAGRVQVKGRGGTALQPGVDKLLNSKDFPTDAPILIITDGYIEDSLVVSREHAYLIPKGVTLPFKPKGKVFRFHK